MDVKMIQTTANRRRERAVGASVKERKDTKLDFEYGQGLMSANLPDNTDICAG